MQPPRSRFAVGIAMTIAILAGCRSESSPPPLANSAKQPDGDATSFDQSESGDPTTPKISIVYSPDYLIDLGGVERLHPFDIRKYEKIHQALVDDGLLSAENTHRPQPLTDEQIRLIHNDAFHRGLADRDRVAIWLEAEMLRHLPVPLDTGILEPFRHASGGTLLAARLALQHGIGINIGGGYHHAKPECGEGFCVFADVPIAIRQLQQEGLIQRAVVIDVDVHQGNGTAVCLANDETTFTFSMHQSDIYPIPREHSDLDVELASGMKDQQYLALLGEHLDAVLDRAAADICFVVAGCDTLSGDPLASLEMTHDGIVRRDGMIIQACVNRNLPVVLTLSGGYSQRAWEAQYKSIASLVRKYSLVVDQQ